jgi:hypothetical protein
MRQQAPLKYRLSSSRPHSDTGPAAARPTRIQAQQLHASLKYMLSSSRPHSDAGLAAAGPSQIQT